MQRTAETEEPDAHPLTIQEAAALRSGELTGVALTEAALARAHDLNDTVGAFIVITDEIALDAARQANADFSAGVGNGPLQGIPFGLKDILATKDSPTTVNSPILDPKWGKGYDSVTTERVRAAGARLMGKFVLSDFAFGIPEPEKRSRSCATRRPSTGRLAVRLPVRGSPSRPG